MERTEILNSRSEKGFTLVELAIVMIIIGLLIGGILKGQELISNAQIAATVAQVKALDAATTTFRDKYDAFPGDMASPATRLPNCGVAGACSTAGNGNGRLDNAGAAVAPGAAPAGEILRFFVHLNAADLVTGITGNITAAAGWGEIYPEAEIAGGFIAAYHPGGALGANTGGSAPGHYLTLTLDPGAAPLAGNTLNANRAFRIDTKIDDGAANTGSVFPTRTADCVAAAGNSAYEESDQAQACDLHIRFQG